MRLASIASGSSGNCIYVGSDCTHLLVDAGISGKKTEEGLNGLGLTLSDIDGILVTHEHADHIKSLGVISRKSGIPLYMTEGTYKAVTNMPSVGKIDPSLFNIVRADRPFFVKDVKVMPMRISHDAAEPVAYRFLYEDKKISVITDLGTYDEYTVDCLKNSDILLCEANHDVRMLEAGPYPYQLKQRILSDHGHLSNETGGRLISSLLHDKTKHIVLGHLSHENNLPELAYETVRLEIEASDTPYHGNDFPIQVARRDCPMPAIEI